MRQARDNAMKLIQSYTIPNDWVEQPLQFCEVDQDKVEALSASEKQLDERVKEAKKSAESMLVLAEAGLQAAPNAEQLSALKGTLDTLISDIEEYQNKAKTFTNKVNSGLKAAKKDPENEDLRQFTDVYKSQDVNASEEDKKTSPKEFYESCTQTAKDMLNGCQAEKKRVMVTLRVIAHPNFLVRVLWQLGVREVSANALEMFKQISAICSATVYVFSEGLYSFVSFMLQNFKHMHTTCIKHTHNALLVREDATAARAKEMASKAINQLKLKARANGDYVENPMAQTLTPGSDISTNTNGETSAQDDHEEDVEADSNSALIQTMTR